MTINTIYIEKEEKIKKGVYKQKEASKSYSSQRLKSWASQLIYCDRKTISKSKTTSIATDDKYTLFDYVEELFTDIDKKEDIRLLGVSFKNLVGFSARQLSFNWKK